MKRTMLLAFSTLAVSTLASGCATDAERCGGDTCPNVGGTWALALGTPAVTGTDAGGCTPPSLAGDLTVVQDGANLTGSFAGVSLTGTAYDTSDFTLRGTTQLPNDGGSDAVNLTGKYLPKGSGDGGESLTGTLTGNHQRRPNGASPQSCSQTASFSGPRR